MKHSIKLAQLSIAVASLLFAFNASAKTQGSYFALDAVKRSIDVKSNSNAAADQRFSQYYNHKSDDSSYGLGVSYKYAFNFNNFFVAPQISYVFANNEAKAKYENAYGGGHSQSLKIGSQLALQANIGYDITDKFAAYIPLGVAAFSYEIKSNDYSGPSSAGAKKTGSESTTFIGLGFSYEITNNLVANLEYNKFQNLKITSPQATFRDGQIVANTSIDTLKFGVAYKF